MSRPSFRQLLWRVNLYAALALLALSPPVRGEEAGTVGPREDYREVARRMSAFIEHEMEEKSLPAFCIALLDGQEIVWARGFGMADPEKKVPATAETVHRVGSVSKLFTAMAAMQLVERGQVDLDVPVSRYLPGFQPGNPFGKPITLRQLLSHRSGLAREPPAGNYFDPDPPGLEGTVSSLNSTSLVYVPERRTKYSNAGVAVAGLVVERVSGRPFVERLEESLLLPLGMASSAFRPTAEVQARLARANMWTIHGRVFPAPTFELGMSPAGSLYASVADLARFLAALSAGGRGPGGKVLDRESLEAMWKPQFAEPDAAEGFGLGFSVSRFEGLRRVGHSGAIYGFATELALLPDRGLGAAAVATRDLANPVVRRVVDHALRSQLAVKDRKEPPVQAQPGPVDPDLARRLAGRYAGGGQRVDLFQEGGRLYLSRDGVPAALRSLGSRFILDDVLVHGPLLELGEDGRIVLDGQSLDPVPDAKPPPPPERFRGLIGEYGWDHNTLYVLERDGRLWVLIEWFFMYPLTERSRDQFLFPDHGLYDGEKVVFRRDAAGLATEAEAAGVVFKRRPAGAGDGTFRIQPLRPVAELRRDALREKPPVEKGEFLPADLVDLSTLDPAIRFEVRYATTDNFLGSILYLEPRAFLQRPAAEALLRAHRALKPHGYGLLIHDGYRPWHVTKLFWEATPPAQRAFVANPALGSRHNRGAAVDLTLYDLKSGDTARMPSGYDEFSDRAHSLYPGGTTLERWQRDLLRRAMEAEGFSVYAPEWWHFDHRDWRRYPILNASFEEIGRPGRR